MNVAERDIRCSRDPREQGVWLTASMLTRVARLNSVSPDPGEGASVACEGVAATLRRRTKHYAHGALFKMLGQDTKRGRVTHWLETLVITLSGPGLGLTLHAADPFWMHTSVPWLLVLPFLCGAQHGLIHAAFSSLSLSGLALAYGIHSHQLDVVLLTSWSLGSLVLGALAGQFRDQRVNQQQHLRAEVAQLSERLLRAERTGQIMTLSHSQLEERLAATRWSLAGSLTEVHKRVQLLATRTQLGEVLLETLVSQAQVQAASLYWAGPTGLLQTPIAHLGTVPSRCELHPLLVRAWKTRNLTTVVESIAGRDGEVLAAVPVLMSNGSALGVIAIHQMSFMAFQADQLATVLMIAGQVGDMIFDRLRALPAHAAPGELAAAVVPERRRSPLIAPAPLGHAASPLRKAPRHDTAALGGGREAMASRVFEIPNGVFETAVQSAASRQFDRAN